MAKLWLGKLNKKIEKFTVGNDYLLDKELLKYDCIASVAHAKMLKKIGVLTKDELKTLTKAATSYKISLTNRGKEKTTGLWNVDIQLG